MRWKGKTLYYDGREVVMDEKRKKQVMAELFEGVDTPYGINALQRILTKEYVGITQKDSRDFL